MKSLTWETQYPNDWHVQFPFQQSEFKQRQGFLRCAFRARHLTKSLHTNGSRQVVMGGLACFRYMPRQAPKLTLTLALASNENMRPTLLFLRQRSMLVASKVAASSLCLSNAKV